MPEEHIPDEFEITAQIWAAQDKIVREVYAITERLSLDPTLAEQMTRRGHGARGGETPHCL